MDRKTHFVWLGLLAAGLLCTPFWAQDTPAETPQIPAGGGFGGRGGVAAGNPDPQPYDRVIPKEAKTTKGLFTVHQVKERYYYENPKGEPNPELFCNSQSAKPTLGAGYVGGPLVERGIRRSSKGSR